MYQSFFALVKGEREGKDFRIIFLERDNPVSIVSPHGGMIEPGTSEIAYALAGKDFSFYAFEGLKRRRNFEMLHITSDRFDEPHCVRMVSRSQIVITVHGCKGHALLVRVGGRDEKLKRLITERLRQHCIRAEAGAPGQAGAQVNNICNRGLSGKGIQLELSAGLRRAMVDVSEGKTKEGKQLFDDFVSAIRDALLQTEM